ncbi:PREDICTED: protein-lysine methyltransferase METTL21C [Nelumbo nucifera]|uniref:Protein N-lysine methyltransferase METTL21A n=2 Tax=Nelumbo nucifera TaxID=4432 RepID=A0A822Y4L0_NELNU|nr:PREDICTED: protein-lysine methyltransferase METTL21C [Nelumbo nucifera]DAD27377.1 TPA_asm: hypothetical protein HUJ06_028845 [Nelumbo nucifera]
MATHSDDDEDINPLTFLIGGKEEERVAAAEGKYTNRQQQHHYLSSIDSTVSIRQLPSEGLSFQLWPAATTLVSLLDRCKQPNNNPLFPILTSLSDGHQGRLRILELGSGTGLVGIAAAAILGADVTITDLPHVLPNLQFNADANSSTFAVHCGTIKTASLRWGESADMESIGREFDLLFASDVVYHDHLFDPLLKTLQFFLTGENKLVFLMAHLRRWKKDSVFFKKARKLFNVEMIHTDPPSPGSRIGVAVYCFQGKLRGGTAAPQTVSTIV